MPYATLTRDRLPPGLFDFLAVSGRREHIAAGRLVYQQGSPARSFSLIVSGQISVFRSSEDGHSSVAAILTAGDAFGLFPLLMKRPRSHTCEAIEDCDLIQISVRELWELIDSSPSARREVIGLLSDRLGRAFDTLEEERRLPLARRLGKRLLEFSEFEDEVSLNQSRLAHQMGVSRNTIGTALKKMSGLGLVRANYGKTVILDRPGLTRWVYGKK
jgi:CRP-like cAMP-binding protein